MTVNSNFGPMPATGSTTARPPPLPPRQASSVTGSLSLDASWTAHDPRSSSTQSLLPTDSNQQNDRRRLLCVYIHGFMGNETSFRSFPAHVHNLLTVLLAETHVVHTKIYPRYRSKRNIRFARDDFSRWLDPHLKDTTDIVLVGHSMGGLLAAEVVLMPPPVPANRPLNHRVLGVINFDVPFLGMHPGVVKSGLASLFSAPEEPRADKWSPEIGPQGSSDAASQSTVSLQSGMKSPGRADTFWANQDPNYNPSFENDVVLPVRKGWRNAWHFVSKNSGNLKAATKQLVTSHLEFGGAMANYGELKTRYARVRALEEENEDVRKSVVPGDGNPPRVRFVNYYTASTGRPKKRESPPHVTSPDGRNKSLASLELPAAATGANQSSGTVSTQLSRTPSPRISLQEHDGDRIDLKGPDIPADETDRKPAAPMAEMAQLDPQALSDGEYEEDWTEAAESLTIDDPAQGDGWSKGDSVKAVETKSIMSPTLESRTSTISTTATLPPIPDTPAAPAPLDVSFIEDKETRKLVEKEHARAVKAYEKAVKDREMIIKDRAKLQEKRERKAKQDAGRNEKDAAKAEVRAKKDALKAEEKAKKDALKAKQEGQKDEVKDVQKELTQQDAEHARLEQEQVRMENEARRMRGEPPLPCDQHTEPKPLSRATTTHSDFEPKQLSRATTSKSDIVARQQSLERRFGLDVAEDAPYTDRSTSPAPSRGSHQAKEKDKGPPKDRKFCTLPPKDSQGQRDPCWVRVFMKDVDEVAAHCGLFFVDERYERLVGDVAERIEGWVREDNDRRMLGTLAESGRGPGMEGER